MANSPMSRFIQHFRRLILMRERAGMTDGQLLESFVSRREAAALEVLMGRHALMVWNVCRRVLTHCHDAEDAFQATFLVLVRRASTIVPRERVANWLYGVAHQTALKARATVAKRGAREKQSLLLPELATSEPNLWPELQPLLDRELSRLSAKYRAVVVLCDLEGKSRKEAARQLGLPEGTVASRLARARNLLARRLTQHGVTVTASALAAMLSQNATSAAVPTSVLLSSAKPITLFALGQVAGATALSTNVAALSQGVLQAMLLTKLKIAAGLLVTVGLLGSGIGVISSYMPTQSASAQGKDTKEAPPKSAIEERLIRENLQVDVEDLKKELAKKDAIIEEMIRELQVLEILKDRHALQAKRDSTLLDQAILKEKVEAEYKKHIADIIVKEVTNNVEKVLKESEQKFGHKDASLAALDEVEKLIKKMKEAKAKEKADPAPAKPVPEKPTAYKDIIGTIQKIKDDSSMLISIGSDAGVKKGDTLDVVRFQPKPMFCGRITIINVGAYDSIGKVVNKVVDIAEGDHVAVLKTIGVEKSTSDPRTTAKMPEKAEKKYHILAVSPDGKRMVTEASDNAVTVWDLASMKVLWKTQGQKQMMTADYSADGKQLIVVDSNKDTFLFDAATGKQLAK